MKFALFFTSVVLLLGGCATAGGVFPSSHQTQVQLKGDNYKIIAHVSATVKESFFMGLRSGTKELMKTAVRGMWDNFEAKHGSAKGRPLALANVTQDVHTTWFLFIQTRSITVYADVIEFQKE